MRLHQFLLQEYIRGGKFDLVKQVVDLMGWKKLPVPPVKLLGGDLPDQAVEEAVKHWNASADSGIGYPMGDDMRMYEKAKSIVRSIDQLQADNLNPITAEYYDAARKLVEVGEKAEAYGKLVYNVGIYLRMLNMDLTRTDGYKDNDEQHQANKTFIRAAMKKLGATVEPRR
jgi:hypothetical protein